MLNQPGIYQIPLDDYINDPCPVPSLSAGVAHALITQSPLHAWMKHPRLNPHYEREDTTATDIGTIAHAMLLENDTSRVVVVEAEDWRTKAAKEARDNARASGKLPVLKHKMGQVEAMVKAAREAIAASEVAEAFKDGKAEQTLVWQEGPIWFRSRPDWMKNNGLMLIDYKTCGGSAEPDTWMRNAMLPNGYDIQAALAIKGMMKLATPTNAMPNFVFAVQETEPPYAMSFIGMSPAFLHLAEVKLQHAMLKWHDCSMNNKWPAYPSQICYMEPPAWAAMATAEKVEVL
jgi:PDDEXK-like uncharacterized protein DUF3799